MRPIHLAQVDKRRPALVLTRESVRGHLKWVTVAPITSRIRGLAVEVHVGPANGLDHECVVSCDNITTIPAEELHERIGQFLPGQEGELAAAIRYAFDLRLTSPG